MNEILITVSKKSYEKVIVKIKDMIQQVDTVSDESTDFEVKEAYRCLTNANAYLVCITTLGLLTKREHEELFIKQMIVSDKVLLLVEKRGMR